MKKRLLFITTILLIAAFALLRTAVVKPRSTQKFSVAKAYFERNVTDGDIEIVFEVKGGDEGMTELQIISPNGNVCAQFSAGEAPALGIRHFRLETPEPKDMHTLLAAYPEGIYRFEGTSSSGSKLFGETSLHCSLPEPSSFLKASNVDNTLVVKWKEVKDITSYIFSIEQNDLNFSFTANLPNTITSFSVPHDFLQRNREYQLGIGTVLENGNRSFVETTFAR